MRFLVWSNEHAMWWRGHQRGYTQFIEEAGRYDRAEAERIVSRASLDGHLAESRQDPVTGYLNLTLPEVMVLAPEEIPGALQWAVKPCPHGWPGGKDCGPCSFDRIKSGAES